eukprot:1059898_1
MHVKRFVVHIYVYYDCQPFLCKCRWLSALLGKILFCFLVFASFLFFCDVRSCSSPDFFLKINHLILFIVPLILLCIVYYLIMLGDCQPFLCKCRWLSALLGKILFCFLVFASFLFFCDVRSCSSPDFFLKINHLILFIVPLILLCIVYYLIMLG